MIRGTKTDAGTSIVVGLVAAGQLAVRNALALGATNPHLMNLVTELSEDYGLRTGHSDCHGSQHRHERDQHHSCKLSHRLKSLTP